MAEKDATFLYFQSLGSGKVRATTDFIAELSRKPQNKNIPSLKNLKIE